MANLAYYIRASGFLLLIAYALYITITAIVVLYKVLKHAKHDPERLGNWGQRIKLVIVNVFGQKKLLRHPAGIGHLIIFYGFIVVTIVSQEVFIKAFFPKFSFSFMGPLYPALIFLANVFNIGVIIAVLVGLIRRYIMKPIRFKDDLVQRKGLNRDATIILIVVGLHMTFGVLLESIEIAKGNHLVPNAAFFSSLFVGLWTTSNIEIWENIIWWLHAFSVWLFMAYIFGTNVRVPKYFPSKHLHFVSTIFNVFFANLKPYGRLVPMDFEDESLEVYGVNQIQDLTWPQLLDLYSCTGCGRCQEVCPAYLNDQPLSPKALILNMREQLLEETSKFMKNPEESVFGGKDVDGNMIGVSVPKETLWACTTCLACTIACPVMNEHVDKIIDMRRYETMMESEFPSGLETVFNNLEVNYNPWGIGKSDRDKWAEDLDIKRMKDHPDAELLFWVGCAGSFDDHAKKVATGLVKILRAAGIDFAILGKEEKCTGDPARRLGNEYLAQDLMTQNVETLNKYNFKEVITICPHCFNNLKNELPDFGGEYVVYHATEYILRLIQQGKIKLDKSAPLNITYHDSCYLGRYNNIYEAPRKILGQFDGVNLIEMKMVKDMAMCCGGGGGRVWFESDAGKDINKTRVNMAEETGAEVLGVSCPFCTIMLEDGVKNMNKDIEVKDLVEIVASHLIIE